MTPENLATFLGQIEKEILPRWKDISMEFDFEEIENFANVVHSIAVEHDYLPLKQWASDLEKNTRIFNVEEIEKQMKSFLSVIDKIKENK